MKSLSAALLRPSFGLLARRPPSSRDPITWHGTNSIALASLKPGSSFTVDERPLFHGSYSVAQHFGATAGAVRSNSEDSSHVPCSDGEVGRVAPSVLQLSVRGLRGTLPNPLPSGTQCRVISVTPIPRYIRTREVIKTQWQYMACYLVGSFTLMGLFTAIEILGAGAT